MSRPGRPHLQGRDRGRSGRRGDRRRRGRGRRRGRRRRRRGSGGGAGADVGADGLPMLELHAGRHVDVAVLGRLECKKDFLGRAGRQRVQLPDDLRVAGGRLRRRAHEGRGGGDGRANSDVMGGGPRRVLDEDAVIDFLSGRGVGRGADVERHHRRRRVGGFGERRRQAGGQRRPADQRRFRRLRERLRRHRRRRRRRTGEDDQHFPAPRTGFRASAHPPASPIGRSGRQTVGAPIVAFSSGLVCPVFPIPSIGNASPGGAAGLSASLTDFAPSPKLRKSERPRPGDSSGRNVCRSDE